MLVGRYTCVLDACVLHPAFLAASLLWFADAGLFQPVWTEAIWDEWQRSLQRRFKDPPEKVLAKRLRILEAFSSAMVAPSKALVDSLRLPDPNDRHVLAAAICGKADAIITANLKHFPNHACAPFDVEIIHPDTFLVNVIDLDETRAVSAISRHRATLRNPPFTAKQFLARFEAAGLVKTQQRLRGLSHLF